MAQRNNLARFYKKLQKEIDKYTFVLSTKVFIEGIICAESYSGRLIDYLIDERYYIALDDRIYLEYFTEIHNKKIEKKNIDYLFAFLKEYGKFVTAKKIQTHGIHLGDSNFLKFIEVAKSSEANAIVILKTDAVKYENIHLFTSVISPEEVFENFL